MNGFALMAGVTLCYTITSLSDKYAAAKAKLSPDNFTFLMCASMSVFLALTLPFQTIAFTLTWQAFAGIALVAVCKLLEFRMSILVLKEMSAFELKAWLGVTLFVSYFADVFMGAGLSFPKLAFICAAALGLVLIVRSDKAEKINYRRLILPLALYLASKFGYGLVIRTFSGYASSIMLLLPGLVLVALAVLPKVRFGEFREKPKGTALVTLARIPNAAGMIMENAVITISLANYSLIQPMILVTLFVIGLIRREAVSKENIIGGVLAIAGVLGFQLRG
ncbi:MAG: hypothetical protein J6N15_05810 [Ruminiclostridium sp.]|nr:hypothetical protein [Ruminiclostridium sp.]